MQQVGARLKIVIRQEDQIGQFSENIFALVIRYIQRKESAAIVAKRLLDTMKEPIYLDNLSINIKLQIGIALFPEDGGNLTDLLRAAESALKLIEHELKPIYQFYQTEMNAKYQLEITAYELLMRNEFYQACKIEWLHYQNQSKQMIYTSQLSAMPDCSMQQQQALQFLEKYGRIDDLFDMLLHSVPASVKGNDSMLLGLPLMVSQVENVHFIYRLPDKIRALQLSPSQCIWLLQLTPIHMNSQALMKGMNMLRYIGGKIGLDEFGEEGWDLSIFKNVKIDYVRLSNTFLSDIVENPETRKLLRHLTYFAKDMGFFLLAPSVDFDEKTKNILEEFNIEYFPAESFQKAVF